MFIVIFDTMKAAHHLPPQAGLLCDFLKYAAIISCLLMCVFSYTRTRERVPFIQTVVFCFTLVADLFLLFTPYFAAGVFVFLGAHFCALLRYRPRWIVPVGICVAAVFFLAMLFASRVLHADSEIRLVIAVCSAYAVLIISVTISTFHAPQPRLNTLFSRIGMCLFLACDVNVAIFNAVPYGHAAHTASIVLMWLFYLPAQTLLALSAGRWLEPEEQRAADKAS